MLVSPRYESKFIIHLLFFIDHKLRDNKSGHEDVINMTGCGNIKLWWDYSDDTMTGNDNRYYDRQ